MIPRYEDERIVKLCSLQKRYEGWQEVELAVIQAREDLGRVPQGTYTTIKNSLESNPIDMAKIEELEKELDHDLNAFLDERKRFIEKPLQLYFHQRMTSYDTEESAFVKMLHDCCLLVCEDARQFLDTIKIKVDKYQYTPMNARTHGQEAEMQSFGKRCVTWYQDLTQALDMLYGAMENLKYSKLSGAVGTNTGIDSELERSALKILGLVPYLGATQILPRILHAPVAQAISNLMQVVDDIAYDIRLAARSGRPLMQEPFGKKQKGSSAMPHKKNTIKGENTRGMARMAKKYAEGLAENIQTWEERSIEQSCVERVFWPDLFQVTLYAIKNMKRVVGNLAVYPDMMYLEIIESRGTFASNAAKEFLAERAESMGVERDDCYRMIQLACFNIFAANDVVKDLRANPPETPQQADEAIVAFEKMYNTSPGRPLLQRIIEMGRLQVDDGLDISQEKVDYWNQKLKELFSSREVEEEWQKFFRASEILPNEDHLIEKVLS